MPKSVEEEDYPIDDYERDSREVRKREYVGGGKSPLSLKIRSSKYSGKRIVDNLMDWNSDQQKALESHLDACYDEQLESEERLTLPYPKRDLQQGIIRNFGQKATTRQDAEERAYLHKRRAEMRSNLRHNSRKDDDLAPFIQLRQKIGLAPHLEAVVAKAREHFATAADSDCLPVHPRTVIVHKEQSEAVLGARLERCILISASSVAGEVEPSHAHRRCCASASGRLPPLNGWQSHARDEGADPHFDNLSRSPSNLHCQLCNNDDNSNLIGFSCGHVACSKCSLEHARSLAETRSASITCIVPNCDRTVSEVEVAALYSDTTIDLFHGFWLDALCSRADAVQCYACPRMLIPLTTSCTIAAECACGARTCARCGLREHLPLACSVYGRWAEVMMKEGITVSHKRYVRSRKWPKVRTTNCRKCGAVDTFAWKGWCDGCCSGVTLQYYDAPVKSNRELVPILKARGRMMSEHFRQLLIACESTDEAMAAELKRVVEDGVFLFELVKISRIIGTKTLLGRSNKKERERVKTLEDHFEIALFAAIETGCPKQKDIHDLKSIIGLTRDQYCRIIRE